MGERVVENFEVQESNRKKLQSLTVEPWSLSKTNKKFCETWMFSLITSLVRFWRPETFQRNTDKCPICREPVENWSIYSSKKSQKCPSCNSCCINSALLPCSHSCYCYECAMAQKVPQFTHYLSFWGSFLISTTICNFSVQFSFEKNFKPIIKLF